MSYGKAMRKVSESLRMEIREERYRQGHFLPSIMELARRFDVAKGTAQRALGLLASEGLIVSRPRRGYEVLAGAENTGNGFPTAYIYTGMYSGGSGVDWDEDAARRTLNEFERYAAHGKLSLLVLKSSNRTPEDVMASLTGARVCGAIIDAVDPVFLDMAQRAGMPTVVIDNIAERCAIDTVAQDGWQGGLLAAGHLAGKGHRRIGWIGPDPLDSDPQVPERLGGVWGGLERAGLELAADARVTAPIGDPEKARSLVRAFLSQPDRPQAFFALWQDMTAALVGAASDLGLRPGRDFDFVGWCTREQYDAGYLADLGLDPAQPMIAWSVAAMAQTAMARLADRRSCPELPCLSLKIPARLMPEEECRT